MEKGRASKNQGLPEKRSYVSCSAYGCTGYMICVFGIGSRHPTRIQCADCLRGLVAMQERQPLVVMDESIFEVGSLTAIDGEVVEVKSTAPLSVGGLSNQIEFEDEGLCGKLVERETLQRRCRRCVYREGTTE